ncbi:phosphoribosyl-ATP diphosphatase [Azospirillum sp. ST 5-10]|uniref:phosphoribosyl-ATP diphosphatase n=1 Tax=unclassified Azospirillum TaxID=2630922 RepID=UPI003F4A828C
MAERPTAEILDRLHRTVASRKGADPSTSYTAKLYARGTAKIAQKLGEEAVETVIEAMRGDRAKIAAESADLLYHLMVLWADAGVEPAEVWTLLQAREGTSGIDEKTARKTEG